MVAPLPNLDHDTIAAFCRKHRIRRMALFGSVLRDDFRPDSDVDVLVEFEPGATPGFGFFGIQEELHRAPPLARAAPCGHHYFNPCSSSL